MKVTVHPPLLVAPVGAPPTEQTAIPWHHASLWLTVDLARWNEQRTGHLHAVWKPDGSQWQFVDLARHPLQPWRGGDPLSENDPETQFRAFLADWDLRFFRLRGAELVSELGEGRGEFRRRASALLRPEIQSRIDDLDARPLTRTPGRRSAEHEHRSQEKSRIAAELSQAVASMEETAVEDPTKCVRRAEVGRLWLAPGVQLHPRRHRDPML